jgi:hypothetical protein
MRQQSGPKALWRWQPWTWEHGLGEEVLSCFLKQWRWINEGLEGMGVPLRF